MSDTITVSFPYTHTTIGSVTLPRRNLGEVISPQEASAADDVDATIAAALDSPLGKPPLEQAVRPGDRVLILTDDNTRPTPVRLILPHILERLQRAGVSEARIQILIASGTHRAMAQEEIVAKVGAEVARRFPVTCHRCDDPSVLVKVGTSQEGIEVWLNRAVVDADFVIGIGNVVPHPHVGWAGGAKILYPGVAGAKTVAAFHRVGADDPINCLGRDNVPARRSLESLADTVGLDFIVDTVLTRDHRLHRVFCGDHRQAQRAAQRATFAVYGVPVSRRYDIVVANSYPAFLEFWQAGKGIFSADRIINEGGTIILVGPCPEGVGVTHPLQVDYLAMAPSELLRSIATGQVEDPIAAAVCAKVAHVKQRARVTIVSEGLSEADVRRMGFSHCKSLPDALEAALAEYGQDARVAVITHGGETVPYVTEEQGGESHATFGFNSAIDRATPPPPGEESVHPY
jgi:nickel-dependent lactate racemase